MAACCFVAPVKDRTDGPVQAFPLFLIEPEFLHETAGEDGDMQQGRGEIRYITGEQVCLFRAARLRLQGKISLACRAVHGLKQGDVRSVVFSIEPPPVICRDAFERYRPWRILRIKSGQFEIMGCRRGEISVAIVGT